MCESVLPEILRQKLNHPSPPFNKIVSPGLHVSADDPFAGLSRITPPHLSIPDDIKRGKDEEF